MSIEASNGNHELPYEIGKRVSKFRTRNAGKFLETNQNSNRRRKNYTRITINTRGTSLCNPRYLWLLASALLLFAFRFLPQSMTIISVWEKNFHQKISLLDEALLRFHVISIDTEFPGFLRNTPRDAAASERYDDLKFNVDNTFIIQLGITLSDDQGVIGGTWEFNFSEFDIRRDLYVRESIELLQNNGLDLEKIRKDGIPMHMFGPTFLQILSKHKNNLKWVTFHGLYDLAYMVKLLRNHHLPPNSIAFAAVATRYFRSVFDIKVVAEYCEGLLGGKLGLSKLAKILHVERLGGAHNAGSDSLLTAAVFARMKWCFEFEEWAFDGFLYGLDARIYISPTRIIVSHYHPMIPQLLPVPVNYHAPPFIIL